MISSSDYDEGKVLWEKLNHRKVLDSISIPFRTESLIAFYDKSYWSDFTTVQQKQLLHAMRQMKK